MREIENRILLFVYCLLGAFYFKTTADFVMAFLTAVALTTSGYFFDSRRYKSVTAVAYIMLGIFLLPCLCFFPIVSYNLSVKKQKPSIAIMLIVLLYHVKILPFYMLCHVVFGLFFSFILQKQTDDYINLQHLYKKTRDDTTELNLLLNKRNKILIEKQDYEVYTATLRERNRIAREIHDNVGHMLSRSILMLGALKTVHKDDDLSSPLSNLEDTLSQAMDSVRQSVHDLHDESINLKEAVENLIRDLHDYKITLSYDMGYDIPKEIKYSFLSILKEALVNVHRHSNATEVRILLREHPGFWQLSIEDNGTNLGEISSGGIGLSNIQERISSLGGRTEIYNHPGFRIFATVPKTHTTNYS